MDYEAEHLKTEVLLERVRDDLCTLIERCPDSSQAKAYKSKLDEALIAVADVMESYLLSSDRDNVKHAHAALSALREDAARAMRHPAQGAKLKKALALLEEARLRQREGVM